MDYKSIAEGARSFYNLGMLRVHKPEQYPMGYSVVSLYVNMAFTCELYMKALILFERPETTKDELKKLRHRLDDLFEALSPPIKEGIKNQLNDQSIQERQKERASLYQSFLLSDAPDDEKDIIRQYIQKNTISFDEMLKNHVSTFENWRYYYEAVDGHYISCDEWFLYNFAAALRNVMVRTMNQS